MNSIKARPLQGDKGPGNLLHESCPFKRGLLILSLMPASFIQLYFPFSLFHPLLQLHVFQRESLLPSHSCPPSSPFRLLSPLPHLFKVFPVCAVIALRITLRSNQQHLTKRCSLTVESSLKQPSYFPTTRHTNCNYTLTAVGTYIYVPVASRRGQRQLNSFQLKIRNTCVRSVIRSKCIRAAGNSRSVRLLLV